MENLFWIGFVGALIAALFAWMQAKRVLSYSEGSERMQKIAASIRSGANAYLKQQYTTVFKVFVVVFIILLVIAFGSGGKMLSKYTPFAFVTGGVFSMLAGFIGMKIATSSNARTAQAASESLNKGLRVAFSLVFTRKEPRMEQIMPHTDKAIGSSMPLKPYPPTAPRAKVARMEPT